MRMIACRNATTADAALLAELARTSFAETFGHLYDPADLNAFLDRRDAVLWARELADPRYAVRVAEADGVAAGFAKLGPPTLPGTPAAATAELAQLYVLRPWQGAGVAAMLMDWALATARADGTAALYLSVYVDNVRAKRFYARYGFERIGACDFMVGNHRDEDDIMRLHL